MIKALVSDFSKVLLFPTDSNYTGSLNDLHKELSARGDYDFWKHFQLNQDLLTFFQTLGKQIDVYVFTTEYIQEHPALQPKMEGIFKKIFSGARLGLGKTDPQSYKTLIKEIGLKPEEILYIDDKPENLEAAKNAGLMVIRYESNPQTIQNINNTLGKSS